MKEEADFTCSERPSSELPKWPIYLLLAVAVLVPVWFWQQVWFGAHLSDEEIRRRLLPTAAPRQVQHACEQISRRMQRDPHGARQFYDLLVPLADHPDEQVRYVVAWCMGEDTTRYRPFHQALRRLVTDEAPRVRYNAALALARQGDPAARPVLGEMLVPYAVLARWEGQSTTGTVVEVLGKQDRVTPAVQLALVETGNGEPEPILAPLGGRVGELTVGPGQIIRKGQPLATIEPDFPQVYQALRALALVGQDEDLPQIERYFDPEDRLSPGKQRRIETQAKLTAEVIRRREARKKVQFPTTAS